MNRFKNIPLLTFFLVVTIVSGYSQLNRCGTLLTDNQRNYETAFTDSVSLIIPLNRDIDVTLYIVKNLNGETGVDMTALNAAFSGLNLAFDDINLGFTLSSPNLIDNYSFDILRKKENETELTAQYKTSNTINLYLVTSLFDETDQEVCAYTYYPAEQKDMVFLSKKCISQSFLIEQFGHFFNLYHTHERGFGEELVKGSNCGTTGDRCCDTPADPNLSGRVNAECQYESLVKDSNNNFYTPSVYNYMSFAPDECNKCFFSEDQYLRIINCILKTKNHLW